METPKKELCTIRIMVQVESDEEALAIKRKVTEALKGNENAQVQFMLTSVPGILPRGLA